MIDVCIYVAQNEYPPDKLRYMNCLKTVYLFDYTVILVHSAIRTFLNFRFNHFTTSEFHLICDFNKNVQLKKPNVPYTYQTSLPVSIYLCKILSMRSLLIHVYVFQLKPFLQF